MTNAECLMSKETPPKAAAFDGAMQRTFGPDRLDKSGFCDSIDAYTGRATLGR